MKPCVLSPSVPRYVPATTTSTPSPDGSGTTSGVFDIARFAGFWPGHVTFKPFAGYTAPEWPSMTYQPRPGAAMTSWYPVPRSAVATPPVIVLLDPSDTGPHKRLPPGPNAQTVPPVVFPIAVQVGSTMSSWPFPWRSASAGVALVYPPRCCSHSRAPVVALSTVSPSSSLPPQ